MREMFHQHATDQKTAETFMSFRTWLVNSYLEGNRHVRSLAFEGAPRTVVDKHTTDDFVCQT